ncbi:MAG: uroporphyrinogen-III C-methyltransferase [Agarilytica sp.]
MSENDTKPNQEDNTPLEPEQASESTQGNVEMSAGDDEPVSDNSADSKTESIPSAAPKNNEQLKEEVQESSASSSPVLPAKKSFPWFTTFVLILLLGFAGATLYVVQQGKLKLEAQTQNFDSLQQLLSAQAQTSQQNLAQQKRGFDQDSARLNKQLKKAQTDISDLSQRLNAQGKRLRALSDTSRDDWLLAEAEYLLKLANQRVRIERSPEGADALLQEADGILRDLDDPNLHSLRRAIAKDLAALRLLKKIDVEGIYLNLVALTEQIESIPTRVVSQRNHSLPEVEGVSGEQAKGFWDTVKGSWKQFTQSFKNYIRVIHHDEKPLPLLPVQDHMYLQQNLRLMLERAQLALLREQQDIYEQSLRQANEWLVTYYNESEVLNKFRNQLAVLQQKRIVQELPDINGSLQQIHDYIADLHNLKGVAKPEPKATVKSSNQSKAATSENSEKN